MEHECKNCSENFHLHIEDRKNSKLYEIDKDQYSTMYREEFIVTCPHCNHSQDEEDEYWINDETGDIIR